MEPTKTNLISLFSPTLILNIGVSSMEIALLESIRSVGKDASCADLQEKIREHTGKKPGTVTLYRILLELRRKSLIKLAATDATRCGRPRQLYRLTPVGRRAIQLGEAIVRTSRDQV